MSTETNIAIIGAGAAGLAVAIFAAELLAPEQRRVVVLDGAKTIGAKILVSGGGRCNVTNEKVRPEDFNGSQKIVRNILAAFNEKNTVQWFEDLGVRLKIEETGKLFPTSDSARTILNALVRRCEELGVTILSDHRVQSVVRSGEQFEISHNQGQIRCSKVVLATGGRSLPKTGSDGGAYEIVQRLGHTLGPTYPALVPLVLESGMFHAQISGLSHLAELSTFGSGKLIDRRTGSMLWTHFGVSGPVVMDASRHWVIAHARGELPQMHVNFFPGAEFPAIEKRILEMAKQRPRASVNTIVCELLPQRLAAVLIARVKIDPVIPIGQLEREARRNLVHALTALQLPIVQDRGWNYAEVTAGGVPLDEIDFRTMQSRKTPGLYLVGEILDCDGRIGGFNFQWAWSTAHVAGKALAR